MIKRSGSTADSPGGTGNAASAEGARRTTRPSPAPGAALLTALAVVWLATMLWSARTAISSNDGTLTITMRRTRCRRWSVRAWSPGWPVSLLSAGLLARLGSARPTVRFVAMIGAGLVTRVLAASW